MGLLGGLWVSTGNLGLNWEASGAQLGGLWWKMGLLGSVWGSIGPTGGSQRLPAALGRLLGPLAGPGGPWGLWRLLAGPDSRGRRGVAIGSPRENPCGKPCGKWCGNYLTYVFEEYEE